VTQTDTPTVPSVVDEVARGEGITLTRGARLFPSSRAASTNVSTLFRWITVGVRTPDGRRVKLEAVRLAGRWLTTAAALARFIAAQQAPADGQAQAPTPEPHGPRTPTQRRRAAERAGEELERRFGI
jgi:hypothetical protein